MNQDPVTEPTKSEMNSQRPSIGNNPEAERHPIFRSVWFTVNVLLVASIFLAVYSAGWEFSTRRYLKGFSDAIVPATSPGDEKVEAILHWMAHGPARRNSQADKLQGDRDPTDTLNYEALLRVCGTATNAFINLVDTGHMEVRRLLLVDSHEMTKHVVAEVLVDGRWIVVDPTFRVVMRGEDGTALTREELSDSATLAVATRELKGYDPTYTYNEVVHIRLARFHFFGSLLRRILDRAVPGWEDTPFMTLIVERESFAAMISAFLLLIFLILLRTALRWYGEKRLGVHSVRIRHQLLRACHAFLDAT
ncbi:MAG TPA: hypothetical protein VN861_05195 [Candidatus Acidoferrales bacterium]|nr:hypothetical protein [Candidatus Acidoferrales bacterium]